MTAVHTPASDRLARHTALALAAALAALAVVVGSVIAGAYPAATVAVVVAAVAGSVAFVAAHRWADTPAASTAIHPAEREGDRDAGHAG